jgi:Ni/Co efflux regulator RcnB
MIAFKASLTALVLSLLVASAAGAQGGHGRDGDRGGRGGGREAYAPRGEPRDFGGRRGGYPGGGPAYPDGRYAPRGYVRPEGPYPSYAPPPVVPGGSWRRGQFLPPGGPALDPRRNRLRSPPPGYEWRGVGRDFYLVQRSTGLILDTAPGGR